MHDAAGTDGNSGLSTPAEITRDLLGKHESHGRGSLFRVAVILCSIFLVLGIVGFVIRFQGGVSDTAVWGYYAALFAFLLTTAQAAPMVAIAPRIAMAHWRRPISRIAELFTAVGLVNLLLFIPLLWVLPSLDDHRRSLWFVDSNPISSYSPHIWATLSLVFLVVCGLALLWLSGLPDLAAVRDTSTGRRHRLFARLCFGWRGTSRQWNMLYHRMGILGAFYFIGLVTVHFFISVDFAMALVPGWIDALFPVTHAVNSLQAATATVLVTMFILRRFGGYRDYIGLDQFWGLGKLMFALSLLWVWFWFSSFIVMWYGNKPSEQSVLQLLMFGPYLPVFVAVFVLNFITPLFAMIWNPLRKSIWGPTLVAVGVLIGTLLDRIRIYVAAYSVPGTGDPAVHKHVLHDIPGVVLPELADVLVWIGAIAGSVLVYLLVSRVFPLINIWEQKELLLYKVHKRFHRTEVMFLGKSR